MDTWLTLGITFFVGGLFGLAVGYMLCLATGG